MCLQTCVGPVCVRGTVLMYRGRECARFTVGSGTRHVSFHTSLDGGGLRVTGPYSGNTGSVRIYRITMRTIYT